MDSVLSAVNLGVGVVHDIAETMFAGILAFAITVVGLWLLLPAARRLGLLDLPAGRKDHALPIPATGGIAMLVGILLAGGIVFHDAGPASLGFAAAAIILVTLGVLDDKFDLPWWLRIAVQVFAALVMVHVGGIRIERLGDVFGMDVGSLGILSAPFTVFATVGIINAVNMVDGSDGLAGLLVLCALVMLDAAAVYTGNAPVYQHAPIVIGAVAGFLALNLRFPWQSHARVFMGNGGSALLGLVIAAFTFRLTQNVAHPASPVLALWLVPIPIIDCLVLMIRRLRNKCSPFRADRNHIHHLMRDGGFGPTRTALALAAFSCICGLLAGVALRLHIPALWLLMTFVALALTWYGITSRRDRAVALFRFLRTFHRAPSVDHVMFQPAKQED